MKTTEANFDGLIGPTHNYGGLSQGNLASSRHAGLTAYPREAALQGLAKMKAMHDAGLVQGILPPHMRPHLPTLRALGFSGPDTAIIAAAAKSAPGLLKNTCSASSMWAANAATISPSADTRDGRLHMSPANLSTMLHRAIEHEQTYRSLRAAFTDSERFAVHKALPGQDTFSDEGAANHVRLCANHDGDQGGAGVELFVYGRDAYAGRAELTFPARQTLQASEAIARRHGLDPARTVYALQSAQAINAGAFHNDVVCVGAMETLFYHEHAFADTVQMQSAVNAAAEGLFEPRFVEVPDEAVPLADAITSYLFNSMLVLMPGQSRLTLVAPLETRDNPRSKAYCDSLQASNGPIGEVIYVDVRQSMQNGGGPACLRLRVVLTPEELAATNSKMLLTPARYEQLCDWVRAHYRETLDPGDIADPELMKESFAALDALTSILGLGRNFYPFQR